ncbi:hypothetical protein D3C80_1898410 [compost metagenome]
MLLHLLERAVDVLARGQAQRVGAGEPADATGEVDIVEQGFAAMAFELDQRVGAAGPAADHQGQGAK